MPAFWICLIVIVVVVGPLLWLSQYGSLDGYLGASPSPADYVTQNAALVINQVRIDGLLKDNAYPYGLNGSLWTLAYEFAWYLVVAILAGLRILRPGIVALLLLLVLAEAAIGWRPLDSVPVVGYALGSRFGISFVVGMLAYLLRDRLPLDDRLAVVAAGIMAVTLRVGGFGWLGMLAFAYFILWAAWRIPLRRFGTHHDVSYGLYIYAFPMQQTLAHFVFGLPYLLFLAASFALTLPLAWASHLFVEMPALRRKGIEPPEALLRVIRDRRRPGLTRVEAPPVAVVLGPPDGPPPSG